MQPSEQALGTPSSGAPGVAQPRAEPIAGDPARRVALATFVGTTIEWYDFFLYATAAALVFGPQFFPELSSTAASMASFATFGVAFAARPFGGIVFGHLGDRVGRKTMLVASLLLMGGATFAIGLLPNYASIGLAAPILLVLLRIVQGIAVGGEWGGAVLMAIEHASPGRRGRAASFPQMGVAGGLVLSSTFSLVLALTVSSETYTDWVWRVPFLCSIVLVGVGIAIRLRVEESPLFAAVESRGERARNPTVEVVCERPKRTLLGAGAYVGTGVTFYLASVYLISYATDQADLPRTSVLVALLTGAIVLGIFTYLFSLLTDRIGADRVLLIGALSAGLFAFPLIELVDTRTGLIVGFSLMAAANAALYAPLAVYFADLFPTRLRYSGASIAYQGGSVLGGAFAPTIAVWLVDHFGIHSIAVYIIVACVVTAASVLGIRRLRPEAG